MGKKIIKGAQWKSKTGGVMKEKDLLTHFLKKVWLFHCSSCAQLYLGMLKFKLSFFSCLVGFFSNNKKPNKLSCFLGSPAQVLHPFLCNEPKAEWLNFCNNSLAAQYKKPLSCEKAWIRMVTNWLESQTKSNQSRPFYDKGASVGLWCWV